LSIANADAAMATHGTFAALACPVHHEPLRRVADRFHCPVCGEVGREESGVLSFVTEADAFYEGKYNNRTKFVPMNDGVIATLPLRIVSQGYATAVAGALPAGSTVVEIGCAGGLAWFARRYRMVGIDLSLTALRLAALDYAHPIQANAMRLPLVSASVDGVISSCFFEHLDDQGKSAVLKECRRVLKPGGMVVFFYDIWTENHVISCFRKLKPALYQSEFLDGDGHIGYASIAHNQALFRASGLQIVRETYHERTPILANSSWQKFSRWTGPVGAVARVMRALTAGAFRLPALAMIAIVDATIGRLFPPACARCVTTIARKP
jgi:SAM-dependent methyltransferase